MKPLIQGQVVSIHGNEFIVQSSSQEKRNVRATSQTVHNGWATMGDHVLIVVNERQEALVMTRFMYAQESAA